MSQEIGYARVSKTEQHRALQLDALKKRGVVIVFTDKQTGVRFDREAFLAAMEYLNEGDTLVVWKLDRLVPSKESTFASCRMEVSLSKLRAGSTLRSKTFYKTSKKKRMILAFAREAIFIVQRLTDSGWTVLG